MVSLVRFCPGCGEALSTLEVQDGQLVVRPTRQAADAREAWFAAVRGNEKVPRRVTRVEPGDRDAGLRLDEGGEDVLGYAELVTAAAEEREWVRVE
ncbi:MAG: hypothetical protein H6739_21850 [Alphaproteobacteria bacterium]|nr:hypothetical protein [Alphaproteobacteria bacterium]